jgi:hypothetical protein
LNGDAGDGDDLVARFFRRVARHFANETALVTPNGELLSHSLDDGLKKWRALPESARKRIEDLGTPGPGRDPGPPAGGVILKVFARALERDAGGALRPYKTEVARSLEPGRDHLWLTQAEWRALIPAEHVPGAAVEAPERVTDRFCRRALIDLVRVGGNGGPRKREEVLVKQLTCTIETVDAVLRLAGRARVATHDAGSGASPGRPKIDDYSILGFAELDRGREKLTRLDLVACSATGHFDEIHGKTLPLGVACELTAGTAPADRAPPSSYTKDYFDAPPR